MEDPTRAQSDPAPFRSPDVGRFAPGTLLAERYRIVSLAGRGGMGEVYRADDQRVGQTVALKFLPIQLENDAAARDRLIAEVRNARNISHPNVCRVYDVGDVDGRYFLTMEYIDGEDLASLLRRIGRLPSTKALEVARQLCAGLAAAHERGVLHRDLKPANVMIDGRGKARIADFGLAVEAGPQSSPSDGAGTLAYMAPECFDLKPATVQSDLYALGLILYETYTGKRPFTASTIGEWQRAHSDSTPTHPSAIVSEIEPAVERIILRCLEKDPVMRPASAMQVAAALPGGDPLAAALAAGETPSPALVAASGEEGTLPRARAWLWFAACLVSLALAVPLASQWHLPNLVPSRDPVLQVAQAHEILREAGYTSTTADSAWWFRTDQAYMRELVRRPSVASRFSPPVSPVQGALIFCYRQSERPLFTLSAAGGVDEVDPGLTRADDVYIELNPAGGLRTLQVGGVHFGRERPARQGGPDWARLFAAAGLDAAQFTQSATRFAPIFAFDTHVAWEGNVNGEQLRVEGAAYQGWPVEFRVLPASLEPVTLGPYTRSALDRALDVSMTVGLVGSIGLLGFLALRNVRAGRGDRKGAARLALVMLGTQAIVVALNRHWTPFVIQAAVAVLYCFGLAFSVALVVWLYYLGLEPHVRRRWPHLLIGWTRLLDGRWRDPLVGRATLAGIMYALWAAAILPGLAALFARWLDMPIAVPFGQSQLGSFPTSISAIFADRMTGMVGLFAALFALVMLLAVRLILRRDWAAWIVLFATFFLVTTWTVLLLQPYALAAPLGPILSGGVVSLATALVLGRHGLLGCAIFAVVGNMLFNTPLTADLSLWYAWRTLVAAAIVLGLSAWGFRNVLGRQTAFSGGVLDD